MSATVADVEKTITLPSTPRLILLGMYSVNWHTVFFISDELLKLSISQQSMTVLPNRDIYTCQDAFWNYSNFTFQVEQSVWLLDAGWSALRVISCVRASNQHSWRGLLLCFQCTTSATYSTKRRLPVHLNSFKGKACVVQQTFFKALILTWHCRLNPGVTNDNNEGSIPLHSQGPGIVNVNSLERLCYT